MRSALALVLVGAVALHSSGCITYTTYKKLDTGQAPLGTAALLGLGETLCADILAAYASDCNGAPDLSFGTWLLLGNATVFGLDALAATGLWLLARDSQ